MLVQHKINISWFSLESRHDLSPAIAGRKIIPAIKPFLPNTILVNDIVTKNGTSFHLIKRIQLLKWVFFNFLLVFILLLPYCSLAQQPDSSNIKPQRLRGLAIGSGLAYGSLLFGLNELWYKNHPQSSFHFFNDNDEWMRVDKLGHSFTAFHLSKSGTEALKWAGMSNKRAGIYGSLGGWLFMLPIEILDGFSAEYGASWGDLIANSAGSLLFVGQYLIWEEVRIKPKFSYFPSPFAEIRPTVLGSTFPDRLLKDYNGQTYWLSASLYKFLPEENRFPRWLNLAVGYGTEGMVYAHPSRNLAEGFNPTAQFYIGPDIDLGFIQSKKRVVKIFLFLLESIRLPAPALEINKNRIVFHPVYF